MTRRMMTLATGLGFALAGPCMGATITMVCALDGLQENPPTATGARGCGRFVIDTTANTVSYRITFGGLTTAETAAHIHGPAAVGANAGIKFNLGTGNPKVGVWTYPEADEADILAGRMYVNIHSTMFGGGEIRGQIADMVCVLDGAQENPPVATPATGFGVFNIDTCTNTLDYHIEFAGLTSAQTAAHIHGVALHGSNAGVQHGIGVGSPITGTWTYPQSLEGAILDGRTYVNVHSTMFPAGEIRGQITAIVAPIDGGQEVPPVAPAGFGCGLFSFDGAADQLGYHVVHGSLTTPETGAHIHGFSPPGVNSGVQHNLGVGTPKLGTWAYAAANEAQILAGQTYVNIHTTANPGGEVRGQIFFPMILICAGDVDCDGTVGFNDLLAVLASWGPCAGCPADVDGDGIVGFNDLLVVLASWGSCV